MSNFRPYKLIDLNDENSYRFETLFKGLLPEKGLALLLGDSGTGKTLMALRIAACLQNVNIQLGKFWREANDLPESFANTTDCGATLYFAGEGTSNLPNRIKASIEGVSKEVEGLENKAVNTFIPVSVQTCALDKSEDIVSIDAMIKKTKEELEKSGYPIKLIIFDTLAACFYMQDENNNSQMQSIVASLNEYAEKYDCLVLAIVHPAKANSRSKSHNRGASSLRNSSDIVLRLAKVPNSTKRDLIVDKVRDGDCLMAKARFEIAQTDDKQPYLKTIPFKKANKAQKKKANRLEYYTDIMRAYIEEQRRELSKDELLSYLNTLNSEKKRPVKIDTLKKRLRGVLKSLHDNAEIIVTADNNYKWADIRDLARIQSEATFDGIADRLIDPARVAD